MPGLLKVGRTDRLPETRALELRTTGVPTPFKHEFSLLVGDSCTTEARVHAALEATGCRVHPGREFFEISIGEAIDAIHAAIGSLQEEYPDDKTNQPSVNTLYLSGASLDLPEGRQEISKNRAADISERQLEIARLGCPSAFQRAASLYFINCPSSMRFRQYSQLYLNALHQNASGNSRMPKARYQDAGRMAADHAIRLLERRWTVAGDFDFLADFLGKAEEIRLGFKEVIRSSKLPESVRDQMLSL